MKKTIQKLMAALLAVAMLCAMAVPAFADNTENIRDHHSFKAFQIFKGEVSDDNTISNVVCGSSIHNFPDFLRQLKADPTLSSKFATADSLQGVLDVMKGWSTSDDDSIAFARFVCNYLYPNADANPEPFIPSSGDVVKITINEAGYYLIVDTTDFGNGDSYHAYNSFLLNVTKAPWDLPITPKVVKPSVKKEVFDNHDIGSTGEDNGWGSSADHAINEEFRFKLTATLPASTDKAYDYYNNKYTVIFNDTLSAGITFDNLDKVEIANVDGGNPQVIDAANYTLNKDGLPSSFKLSIDDVKTCAAAAGLNLNDGATITVTYTAHLNDKATVNTEGGSTSNINKVYLTYSNNPKDESSIGKTPESTPVYVYTYQLNNTKHQDTENGPALEGACFRLYSDEACTDQSEVQLYQKDGFYYPIKDALGKEAVEMKSAANGTFNVKGLDAGTYYLKEITPPDGYSACKVIPVTIKADHSRNDQVNLEGSNLTNDIVNIKAGGITLPSTGGIGTTLFYVIGGGLMAVAAVLLVTKKRMNSK